MGRNGEMDMKTFKQFLNESNDKNTHLEHMEDSILNDGIDGARQAINYLRALRDMLAGHSKSKVNVTVKWDGCLHEDTVILTDRGDMRIKDVIDTVQRTRGRERMRVMGRDMSSSIPNDQLVDVLGVSAERGWKSWVEVTMENGESIRLTEDHEVHTTNRGWVAAGKLTDADDITTL